MIHLTIPAGEVQVGDTITCLDYVEGSPRHAEHRTIVTRIDPYPGIEPPVIDFYDDNLDPVHDGCRGLVSFPPDEQVRVERP